MVRAGSEIQEMSYAHKKGVLHRDLKPEIIKKSDIKIYEAFVSDEIDLGEIKYKKQSVIIDLALEKKKGYMLNYEYNFFNHGIKIEKITET